MNGTELTPIAEPTRLGAVIGHGSPDPPAPSPERAQALDQEAHEGGRVDVDRDTGVGRAAAAAAPVDDRASARKLRRAFHLDVQVLRGQEPRAHEFGYRDRVVHRV